MRLNLFLPHRGGSRGRRGPLRRILGLLGPSWAAAPLRRVVQAAALTLFAVLLFHVCWSPPVPDQADAFADREFIDAETFLALDPLVGISTSVAARTWVRTLAWAGAAERSDAQLPGSVDLNIEAMYSYPGSGILMIAHQLGHGGGDTATGIVVGVTVGGGRR